MRRFLPSSKMSLMGASVVLAVVTAALLFLRRDRGETRPTSGALEPSALTSVAHSPAEGGSQIVEFPQASWAAADVRLEAVTKGPLSQSIELTGKVAINEDRVAHIFPLVDGRVDEVKIKLGDKVKQGELLVVVQSTEVGRVMLQLYQDRMQRDFALTKDRWTQMVATNTQHMISLIRAHATLEDIESQLTDHPMGEYREKLMTAFVASYKARKTLERLKPLSESGSITGKQLLDAESEGNASRATLQSLLEQFQQETQQSSAMSAQAVKEMQTRVAVDETHLRILGFKDAELEKVDPITQGETISHYPIYSPFDGTIISKDVVLLERVGPESQILSIADLSTVWVTTDVYEEHLPLLSQLEDRTITFRSPAWPRETFEARIFYTGDLVHESSRTVSMRALADNRDGKLRPGMFVTVAFPSLTLADVVRVPRSAILEHAGKSFAFVHVKDDQFERRDVTTGVGNSDHIEIREGLTPGDNVVVSGSFALKTRMLAELLSE